MNCSKCGTPLAEGSTVCGVCGAPVSPQSTVVPVAPEAPVTSNVEPNVSVAAPSAPVVTPEAPVAPVAPEVTVTPVAPVAPVAPVVEPVVEPVVANQTVTPEAPVAPVTPTQPVVETPVVPVTSEVVNQPIVNQDFSQNPNGVVPPQGPGLQQQMMGTPVVPMQPQKKDNKFMIIIIAMLLVIVVLGVIAFGDKIGINVGKSNNNSGEVKKDDSNDKEDKEDDKDDVVTRTIVKYTISGIDVLITDDIKVYEQGNGALLIGDNKTFQSLIQLLPGNIDELSTELNEVSNDLENSSDIITKTYGGYKTVYVSGTLEGNNVDFGIMDVDGTAVLMFCTKKTSKTNIDNVFEIYADIIDSIFATNNFNSNDSNIGNDITNDGSITDDVKFDDLEEE